MRGLVCLAALALAAACDAPDAQKAAGPGNSAEDPNLFRAERKDERSYAGEWASDQDSCNNQREVWTIEENRMGMRRQRFCVFSEIRVSRNTSEGEAWRADARCLADGRQSDDVVFFRMKERGQEMRVTINDADAVDLVRCPMRT